ncbi:MAG: hypothetical protein ACK496_02220 [Acidobacteriota bacterium]
MHRLLIAILCLLVLPAPAATPEFRAGAHAEPITPSRLPTPINGGMRGAFAATVHDPMLARSFALADGRRELIFTVVDSCMVPREVSEQAKAIASRATGVPTSSMLISATHTHYAATMTPVFQSDPDPEYLATLPTLIARSIIQAHRNLEPAEIAWGKGADPSQLFNRRWLLKPGQQYTNPLGGTSDRVKMNPGFQNPQVSHPVGPIDPEITIIAARAVSDQRPLALLANYSLHYVGGYPAISADYFGVFAARISRLLEADGERYAGKPPFVGIMSNGTSGDVNNVNYAGPARKDGYPGEQLERVAQSVAAATLDAYASLTFHRHLPIASAESDLRLRVRKATSAELARAREIVEKAPRGSDGQLSDQAAIYAREALLLDLYPLQVPVRLQVHRLGELSIAAIPCEVFTAIGLELKSRTPFEGHFTISLANGYNGYLPTPAQHRLGGYETWRARSSYLETDASEKIVGELRRLMQSLRNGPGDRQRGAATSARRSKGN